MHGMSAFFSGTDWENLEDRAAVSNYFLMLIVNFSGSYCAKVAYKGLQKGNEGVKLEFANNVDGLKPLELGGKKDKDVLVIMDCKIVIETVEIAVDEAFKNRWEAVVGQQKREEEEAKKKRATQGGGVSGYRGSEHGTWKNGVFKPDAWSGGQWNRGMMEASRGYGDWWEGFRQDDEWVQGPGDVWVKENKEKKKKKISEMTEKEWQAEQEEIYGTCAPHLNENVDKLEENQIAKKVFEQGIVFDIRHAKAYLNSILYGTYMPSNFNDCISKIEGDNKGLANIAQLELYVEDFDDMLQEHFDVIWPNGTINQYCELLQCVIEYLFPYKYNRLVKEMLEVVEQEIKISSNIVI